MAALTRRDVLVLGSSFASVLLAGCSDVVGGYSEDEQRALRQYRDGYERNEFAHESFEAGIDAVEQEDYETAKAEFEDALVLFRDARDDFDEIASFYASKLENEEIRALATEASAASDAGGSAAADLADEITFFQIDRQSEETVAERVRSHASRLRDGEFVVPAVDAFEAAL